MASKDRGFSQLIIKLKTGFSQICHSNHVAPALTSDNSPVISKDDKKQSVPKKPESAEVASLQSKLAGYERIMREMKKQIAGQKTEI